MNRRWTGLISIAAVALIAGGLLAWFYSANGELFETATAPAEGDLSFYRSGRFRVGVSVNPATPEVGENRLTVQVQDAEGNAVSGAKVRAVAQMTMAGMSPMQAAAGLEETASGVYQGPFELEMSGAWPLSISIEKHGMGETRLAFDMATGRRGLDIASGGTPVGPDAGRETAQTSPMDVVSRVDAQGFYRAGKYKLLVEIEPEPPVVGANRINVHLGNETDEPVSGARVRAVAQQTGSDGAPTARTDIVTLEETAPGEYHGTLDLPQGGDWTLTVEADSKALGHADLVFDVATGEKGLRLTTATPGGISHYTCSMHPSVKSSTPGACPICGMDLAPVTKEEFESGAITVDASRRQLIGVELGEAAYRELTRTIRAVGRIDYDETRLSEISLRFDAWIGELAADYVGKVVNKGEVLFTVYGPELLAAQQEYLETRKRLESMGADGGLIAAARKRLLLWGMKPTQIDALERRGEPLDYVPIMAPRSGTVLDKQVVEGTAKQAGTTLMRIADLSRVWVEAEVYETELPLVEAGMPVTIALPYLPGHVYEARVDYVYPYLDADTRTGRIRLILENPDGVLKPDMYAEVKLEAELGRVLAVPEEAVLFAGESRVVFVDLGDGELKPQKITTGRRADGYIEVLEGLEPGATVVTSGNFLIAAETRLKTGMEQW